VAELTRRQLGFSEVFAVVAVAALVSTVALLVKQASDRNRPDGGKPLMVADAGAH